MITLRGLDVRHIHFDHQDEDQMIHDKRYNNTRFLVYNQLPNVLAGRDWKRGNNFKLLVSGFKTREYSLAQFGRLGFLPSFYEGLLIFVALLCLVILMEYRVDLRQQVLCISMGDVKQTSLDVMVTCVRFRSDVIRMKALCNHPKSNLGSRPTLIRPQKSTFERFYPAGQCSLFQINFCAI